MLDCNLAYNVKNLFSTFKTQTIVIKTWHPMNRSARFFIRYQEKT